jgi:hypothetical protein
MNQVQVWSNCSWVAWQRQTITSLSGLLKSMSMKNFCIMGQEVGSWVREGECIAPLPWMATQNPSTGGMYECACTHAQEALVPLQLLTLLEWIFLELKVEGCDLQFSLDTDSTRNKSFSLEILEPLLDCQVQWNVSPIIRSRKWGLFCSATLPASSTHGGRWMVASVTQHRS